MQGRGELYVTALSFPSRLVARTKKSLGNLMALAENAWLHEEFQASLRV